MSTKSVLPALSGTTILVHGVPIAEEQRNFLSATLLIPNGLAILAEPSRHF